MYNTDFSTLSFAGLDSNLVQATLASISSNSMSPIIKKELKLKIQSKRLASGKEELPKPIFKEPEKYERACVILVGARHLSKNLQLVVRNMPASALRFARQQEQFPGSRNLK